MFRRNHSLVISIAFSLMLTLSGTTWILSPRTRTIQLRENEDGIYTSEIFSVPLRIKDAELDVSLMMNSYLKVWCEVRAGENYVRFNFNDLSMDYHFEYDIFEVFGSLTGEDVSVTVRIETDGRVRGTPQVTLTYYGLW